MGKKIRRRTAGAASLSDSSSNEARRRRRGVQSGETKTMLCSYPRIVGNIRKNQRARMGDVVRKCVCVFFSFFQNLSVLQIFWNSGRSFFLVRNNDCRFVLKNWLFNVGNTKPSKQKVGQGHLGVTTILRIILLFLLMRFSVCWHCEIPFLINVKT